MTFRHCVVRSPFLGGAPWGSLQHDLLSRSSKAPSRSGSLPPIPLSMAARAVALSTLYKAQTSACSLLVRAPHATSAPAAATFLELLSETLDEDAADGLSPLNDATPMTKSRPMTTSRPMTPAAIQARLLCLGGLSVVRALRLSVMVLLMFLRRFVVLKDRSRSPGRGASPPRAPIRGAFERGQQWPPDPDAFMSLNAEVCSRVRSAPDRTSRR